VRDEHDLLGAIALQQLPFAVPAPARTIGGDTLGVIESVEGPRLATLFTRITGEPAAIVARNARLAGGALAQLDLALGRLDRPVRDPPTIRDVHPLVPDPFDALAELDLGDEESTGRRLLEHVDEAHVALAGSLPWQIVHGDFVYPNVLVAEGAVTGILDFEFAASDIRAADLATAMYVTVVRGPEAERWTLLEAAAAGYRRALALDPAEAAAVPDLMRRRNAFGIVHWIGRVRQGVAARTEPIERIGRGRWLAGWLDENAARVVSLVGGDPARRVPERSPRAGAKARR
jgi:Ser/Thr protein kinase RdoA (MazF antagonist)